MVKLMSSEKILQPSIFNLKCYLIGPNKVERWIIVGTKREYTLTERSCSCHHFMVQAIRDQTQKCKHLKILEEAKDTNNFDTYHVEIDYWKVLQPHFFSVSE